MSEREKVIRLNAYMDLWRAAVSLYRNPRGEVWRRFVRHALEILRVCRKSQKLAGIYSQLLVISRYRRENLEREKERIADRILTSGILLKPS